MGGVGDIMGHHAATLQGNEGVGPAIHTHGTHTLASGPALPERSSFSVVVGGVEIGEVLGGEGLEVVAAGKDFLDAGVSDLIECERPPKR